MADVRMAVMARYRRLGRTDRTVAVVIVLTVLAAYFRFYRLSQPGYLYGLIGYDDGVYFGASVNLVHGVLPYRDFVLVHPPLLPMLMTPFAFLAKSIGTAKAFGYARILSALVSTAAIPMLGGLLRHRGTVAVAIGCALLAVHTDTMYAARSVFLEPYLVLFCLWGLLVLFHGDQLTDRPRRQFWGGVLFGLGCAVKVFALAPLAVLVFMSLRAPRRAVRIVIGAAVGFAVPVLPFFVQAPYAFLRDVFYSQLTRTATRTINEFRLKSMLGLTDIHGITRPETYIITAAIFVIAAVGYTLAWRQGHRGPTQLEVFAIAAMLVIIAMFLVATSYFWHYAGFFAPFGALALALPTTALVRRRPTLIGWSAVAAVLVLAMLISDLPQLEPARNRRVPVAVVNRVIPDGACVVSNISSLLLVVNRFSTASTCPHFLDGLGVDIVFGHGADTRLAANSPGARTRWFAAVKRAKYLMFATDWLIPAPWRRGGLRHYVHTHYRRVKSHVPLVVLFVRKAAPPRSR